MLLENIPLGKTLEIYVDREEYRYRLVSKVEDTDDRRVCVTAIAANGRFFKFEKEDRIRLVYRDQEVIWEWDKVRAGLAKIDDTPVHYFQIVDKGRTFNRRNAYRVKLLEEITLEYYLISGKRGKFSEVPMSAGEIVKMEKMHIIKPAYLPESIKVKGMLKDVSENGAGLYTDEKFEIGDGMFFEIPSPYGNLSMKAQVIRKLEIQSSGSRFQYYYGCILTQSDRKLLRFIFDLQRERLKKQREMED